MFPVDVFPSLDPAYDLIRDRIVEHPFQQTIGRLGIGLDQKFVGESATVAATGVAKLTAGDLEIGARALIGSAGSSRDLVLNVSKPGAINVGNAARLRGILTAPRSNVSFGPMSVLEGSVRGQSVTLMPGVRVSTHRDCDPIADPDCDGTASCP